MKALDDFSDLGIVVIDMQEFFVDRTNKLIGKQNELFDIFRKRGARIYLIESFGVGDTLEEVSAGVRNEFIVQSYLKNETSCFLKSVLDKSNKKYVELGEKLKKDKMNKLIFTGAYGEACVWDSLLDALYLKYVCFSSEDLNYNLVSLFSPDDYAKIGVNYFKDLNLMVGNLEGRLKKKGGN